MIMARIVFSSKPTNFAHVLVIRPLDNPTQNTMGLELDVEYLEKAISKIESRIGPRSPGSVRFFFSLVFRIGGSKSA